VNFVSTCSADLCDISRHKPSRGAPNLKYPRAPKMKISPCVHALATHLFAFAAGQK